MGQDSWLCFSKVPCSPDATSQGWELVWSSWATAGKEVLAQGDGGRGGRS